MKPSTDEARDELETRMRMQQVILLVLALLSAPALAAEEQAQEVHDPGPVTDNGSGEEAQGEAAEIAKEDDLLVRIAAAHQERTQMQGRLLQRMLRADDPMQQVTEYSVVFYLKAPDHYHIRLQPVDDPESTEWFLSNGAYSWHAVQDFADEPPLVTKKEIERSEHDEDNRDAFARISDFFRMELDGLREDFHIRAIDLEVADDDDDDEGDQDRPALLAETARYLVLLTARRRELQEHVNEVFVELDEDFGTLALRVIDGSGNTREFVVREISYPEEIDLKLFTWPEPRTHDDR